MTELSTEEKHYKKIGKFLLLVSLLHYPLFGITAYFFNSEYTKAFGLATFFILPQVIAYLKHPTSKLSLYIFSFTIMCLSGILIHLGKGMIEMHFHIFTFIPITALFGLPLAPVIAAGTIAIHHVLFFFLLPASLFNYEASFPIVLLHATFVIVETIVALYICFKFKDFLKKQSFVDSKLSNINKSYQEEGSQLKLVAAEISNQSNEQEAHVGRTVEALLQIKGISEKKLESVKESSFDLQETSKKIVEGLEAVSTNKKAVKGMTDLILKMLGEFQSLNAQIKDLDQIIQSVSAKTLVINDIVFQTKLLSFNASVEAARAGENGKGFAVVAEEIGNLAQTSGKAASEINHIIEDSQNKVAELINKIGHSGKELEENSSVVSKNSIESADLSVEVLNSIEVMSSTLRKSMEGILAATVEQNLGIEDIKEAMDSIENLTKISKQAVEKNKKSSNLIEENNLYLEEFIDSYKDEQKKAS